MEMLAHAINVYQALFSTILTILYVHIAMIIHFESMTTVVKIMPAVSWILLLSVSANRDLYTAQCIIYTCHYILHCTLHITK